MNTLILTVGLPRSGKSTWARSTGYPMVNPDSIRLALHGQAFLPSAEPLVWTLAHYMVHALFLAGHATVILDATSVTKARRDEWLDDKWTVRYRVFDTPKETCIVRAGDGGLVLVIERMALAWEPVSCSCGAEAIRKHIEDNELEGTLPFCAESCEMYKIIGEDL
jgi:predicted kinase